MHIVLLNPMLVRFCCVKLVEKEAWDNKYQSQWQIIFDIDKPKDVQGSTNRRALGLVNLVLALAYHFCLNLPAAFTQPGDRLLVEPCIML